MAIDQNDRSGLRQAPDGFGRHQGPSADLDRVQSARLNQDVNGGATDAERLGGVLRGYGNWFHVYLQIGRLTAETQQIAYGGSLVVQ